MRFAAVATCLLVVSVLFPRQAAAQQNLVRENYDRDGTTRIEVDSVFSGALPHGFKPVRVTIRNGGRNDRTWNLKFVFGGGWNRIGYTSTFSVSAQAGGETVQDLLVPVPTSVESGSMYRSLSIQITSAGLQAVQNADSANLSTGWPSIGLSEKLADRNANRLDTAVQKLSGGHRSDTFGHRFRPEMLPADWRGYSGLDVVMMTDGEWRALRPGTRRAMIEWTRLGGKIDLYTTGNPSDVIQSLELPGQTAVQAKTATRPVSLGVIRLWKWNGQDLVENTTLNRYRDVKKRSIDLSDRFRSNWTLHQVFGRKAFNPFLVIILLIVFGIIVGPVNLFVWAKPGQRHRLFITTPIISLIASVLILLLILFNDGVGGNGLRMVLANLQPEAEEKRLYITQEQISRTGVLLGSTFKISDPVFLSPVMIAPSEWNRLNLSSNTIANYSLRGQLYRGDWYQSRSEQGHFIQAVRPTRSRIEVAKPSGGIGQAPELFSSLEFAVDEFFYHDETGRVWKAVEGRIAGGQEITLKEVGVEDLENWWKRHAGSLSKGLHGRASGLWKRKGHFFAVSSDRQAGFVRTLDAISWNNDTALIFGTVPAASGKGAPVEEARE